jgi:hypothetical protein
MTDHDQSADQQDVQGSTTQREPEMQTLEQEAAERPPSQDESDQDQQGTFAAQEAERELLGLPEQEVPQPDEMGTPPQDAGERGNPMLEPQEDDIKSSSPEEPPVAVALPVPSEPLEAAGE